VVLLGQFREEFIQTIDMEPRAGVSTLQASGISLRFLKLIGEAVSPIVGKSDKISDFDPEWPPTSANRAAIINRTVGIDFELSGEL